MLSVAAWPDYARAESFFAANYGNGTISLIDDKGVARDFATGFSSPRGLAKIGDDLFVADSSIIFKTSSTGVPSPFAAGFSTLRGLAADSRGGLYASDIVTDDIYKFSPTGTATTLAHLPSHPFNLAFAGSGDLYVAASTQVCKVTNAGAVSTVATGLINSRTLALDAADNLYVGQGTSMPGTPTPLPPKGIISRVSASGAVSTFVNLPTVPEFMVFDANGDLLVSSLTAGVIYKVSKAGAVSTFASGLSSPLGLALNRAAVASQTAPLAAPNPFSLSAASGGLLLLLIVFVIIGIILEKRQRR